MFFSETDSTLYISSGTDKENLFNYQSFFGGDRFLHSHDLNKGFSHTAVRRN